MTSSGTDRPWTRLIDHVCAGGWKNPETGLVIDVAFKRIDIGEALIDSATDRVREVMPATRYAIVSDFRTHDALASRLVARFNAQPGLSADDVVLQDAHADEATVAQVQQLTRQAEAVIAVGSGTINDLCKHATALDGRDYCVFGTAASMNGYTSATASITLANGMKATLPSHAAKGVFLDLSIASAAPQYLSAAGFGDSLCRSTAQVDWYLAHRLHGTAYSDAPYRLHADDEALLIAQAAGVTRREPAAIGALHRVLTLGGLGISVVGSSHPGSMGEHQISHWIDNFAASAHPGSIHGQQIGIASLTMARLQAQLLSEHEPPTVKETRVDERAIRKRYPAAAVDGVLKVATSKALSANAAALLNEKLTENWTSIRERLLTMHVPPNVLEQHLRAASTPLTPADIDLDPGLYQDAVRHAAEIRDRYSMLDLASDAGLLDDFVASGC